MGASTPASLTHAVGFIQHRAEFLLEDQRGQARAEILQFVLQVFAHEEIGIRKTGAHHVFVALAHQVKSLLVAVADDHEIREQGRDSGHLAHRRRCGWENIAGVSSSPR